MDKEENSIITEEEKNVVNIENKAITNEEAKNYYDTNKEVEKDIKNNEKVLQEKIDNIMSDLDEIDNHENSKKRRRTIFFTIAIIIEILIIMYILVGRKPTKKEYKMSLKCRNSEDEIYENYAVRMTNIYYFNEKNEVAKTENEILYAYNDKETYDFNTKDIKTDKNIKFSGYTEQSTKNDTSYIYKRVITYDYEELKKNKKVNFDGNIFTFTIPGNDEETTIMLQNYDEVLITNQNMGFTCE